MKILLVSATSLEIAPLIKHFDENWEKISFFEYAKGNLSVFPLVTGAGAMQTAFAMARFPDIKEVDLAVNVGIAGTFSEQWALGQVVTVDRDQFGDLGVEDGRGGFLDMYDLDLDDANRFPYENGVISNPGNKYFPATENGVKGLTVNTVTGTQPMLNRRVAKYNPDIETMEGAAFAYACKAMDVKYVQWRSISNRVEIRNRENWKIGLALENLTNHIIAQFYKLT